MKKTIVGTLIVLAVAAAVFVATRRGDAATSSYRFVEIEQGVVEAVVAATGQLSAVTTVQVGTQVSGQVLEIFVDFNDLVRRGQLIARIDATILRQAVLDAEATLDRIQADLERRIWEYDRTNELFARQGVTESEYKTAEYDLAAARANLKSAEVSLDRARNNLAYTEIYAPIDGVVVERNVEPGQTVAASMSTPQLFLIANDLAKMEILASVDESDIGLISEGREARFTVQAYPDESFEGTVRQVRLQSSVQENVVNYTVVVSVRNDDGRLLPGMTATVDFIVDRVEDVIKVPNVALRFRPNQAMMAELQERQQAAREARLAERDGEAATDSDPATRERPGEGERRFAEGEVPDSIRDRFRQMRESGDFPRGGEGRPGAGGGRGGFGDGQGGPDAGGRGGFGGQGGSQLWYVDADGLLQVARVRPGVTDGQYTEVMGRGLEPGMQVIAGVVVVSSASAATNPFQQPQQNRRGFGRGF